MKIINLIWILILMNSCNSSKELRHDLPKKEDIVYIFPNKVIDLLRNEIKDIGSKGVYFFLHSDSSGYEVFVSKVDEKNRVEFIANTNRKVFLDGEFYPLIFNYDNIFATTATPDQVLAEYNRSKHISQHSKYIVHHGFSVKFNEEGKIIK